MSLHVRPSTLNRIVALTLVAVAATFVGTAAWARPDGTSPACQAALKRIAYANTMIKRLEANLKNPNVTRSGKIVNPVRARQITVQLARLKAELAAAEAVKAKVCPATPTEPGAALAAYDGTYNGQFTGTRFVLTFTVASGVVTGDVVSVQPLNPATGNVTVRASFAGADCGTLVLHIDPKAGTATAHNVTCTMAGQSATGDVVAQRG
jgi:hypothetical protein